MGIQEKYENELDTKNKEWKAKLSKAVADHKNAMSRLKDEHLFAMNRLTEEHDVSRLKFENEKKNSNRELDAKQQVKGTYFSRIFGFHKIRSFEKISNIPIKKMEEIRLKKKNRCQKLVPRKNFDPFIAKISSEKFSSREIIIKSCIRVFLYFAYFFTVIHLTGHFFMIYATI